MISLEPPAIEKGRRDRAGQRGWSQFVMGWNRSEDQAVLIVQEPIGDRRLVAKVAVVVRALADRDEMYLPAWVGRLLGQDQIAELFGELDEMLRLYSGPPERATCGSKVGAT